jgi:lipopolysaccharide export system permease protein
MERFSCVSRFDRYLLLQLLTHFGFFALILVAIYWINRAVGLFEQLIGDGQSGLVFLEFSILSLPNMINIVLPIAAFAGAVYVTNRLTSESELVVMQATGFSCFRLSRPVLIYGLCVALIMAVLMHVLIPLSRSHLATRTAEIAQTANARFLTAGQFTHPGDGLTLYIKRIDETGALLELFLSDDRKLGQNTTYTATRALFAKTKNGPKLLMFDGMIQNLDLSSKGISVTRFADFTFDLGSILEVKGPRSRSLAELSTPELFAPSAAVLLETGQPAARLLFEGHGRFAQPALATAAAMVGFSTLLLGAFSRFGLWRQILVAIMLLILIQAVWTVSWSAIGTTPGNWPFVYLAPLIGLILSVVILYVAQNPGLFRAKFRSARRSGDAQ